ncbi:MAG: HAD-IC family P-type ATPase, partial [Candidatus Eiseniibacteriota bacterium]
ALASNEANSDPIDIAIIKSAKERNISTDTYIQERFVPFDPVTKRTESILEKEGEEFVAIKGAVLVIIPLCKVRSVELESIENKMRKFAEKGYRTIAIATNHRKSRMELVGIVALYDPPRPDSAKLVEKLGDLGISVKMLTGDSLPIAKEIAKQTKVGDKITRMSDLMETKRNDAKLADRLVLLYLGMNYLGLSTSVPKLQTFVLCILMISQACNMLVSRERRHFWDSRPSKMFLSAIVGNIAVTAVIATIGIPGISSIPLIDVLLVLTYSLSFPLLINDFVKVKLIKIFVDK